MVNEALYGMYDKEISLKCFANSSLWIMVSVFSDIAGFHIHVEGWLHSKGSDPRAYRYDIQHN